MAHVAACCKAWALLAVRSTTEKTCFWQLQSWKPRKTNPLPEVEYHVFSIPFLVNAKLYSPMGEGKNSLVNHETVNNT